MFHHAILMGGRVSFILRIGLLISVVLVALIGIACFSAIPQDPAYHKFAGDQITFGVPNVSNVLSNVGFVIAGIVGLLRTAKFTTSPAKYRWSFFFASIVFVGIGSAYYHWSPSHETLFWDRLPMTLGFAALTACLFAERLGERVGRVIFTPLIFLGVASVIYWLATEKAGAGDLRPYILVQFLPMVLVPLLLILFPKGITWDRPYWILLAGYAMAKGFEWQDIAIYDWTTHIISGHVLKHIAAALAIICFYPHIEGPVIDEQKEG